MTNDEWELARSKVGDLEQSRTLTLEPGVKRRVIAAVACFANLAETPLRHVEILHHTSDVEEREVCLAMHAVTPERQHLTGHVTVTRYITLVGIMGGLSS